MKTSWIHVKIYLLVVSIDVRILQRTLRNLTQTLGEHARGDSAQLRITLLPPKRSRSQLLCWCGWWLQYCTFLRGFISSHYNTYNSELTSWVIPGMSPVGKQVSGFVQSGCWSVKLCSALVPSQCDGHSNVAEQIQFLHLPSGLSHNLGPGIIPEAATFCSSCYSWCLLMVSQLIHSHAN